MKRRDYALGAVMASVIGVGLVVGACAPVEAPATPSAPSKNHIVVSVLNPEDVFWNCNGTTGVYATDEHVVLLPNDPECAS